MAGIGDARYRETVTKVVQKSTEQMEETIIQQGDQILAITRMPGWAMIEKCLELAKQSIEEAADRALMVQVDTPRCIYFMGLLNGINITDRVMAELVRKSKDIAQRRADLEKMQGGEI